MKVIRMQTSEYLVFTDLDGTLLNHDDYDFADALQAIDYLNSRHIPIIISTSKTFSEVIKLQKKLNIRHPFVVENGAGIFIPSDCILADSMIYKDEWIKVSHAHSYIELRLFFTKMKRNYPIRGFGDMSVEEVSSLTCLEMTAAEDAMKRDFTEPFLLEDSSLFAALKSEANFEGFDIVEGGRFYHLISMNQDKASAMLQLTHLYDEFHNILHKKIALGDSANDFTMIQQADIGVLIPKDNGTYASIGTKDIKKAKHSGPKGWNEAILEIFDVSS